MHRLSAPNYPLHLLQTRILAQTVNECRIALVAAAQRTEMALKLIIWQF